MDDIGYTIGMKFSGNGDFAVSTISEFFWNEKNGLCVRYAHGGWDRLPLEFPMIRIKEKTPQLYPPADTKPAVGQIWQELNVDHNVPAVGDIYEWTGSRYPGIFPGKRYTVKVVSEKHKYIVELENLMGTYDFSPHLKTKWKLVRVGKDYVFEKSTRVWLQSQTRSWSIGNQAVYIFYSEKGEKVEVTENGFQQNVLSGNWTIYSEEEAWTIKSSLKNKLTPCYPKGIDIGFSKIDDLEEIVSKPTKQENKKMNLIEVMDIKDIQIKQVDEEVIKDKQCELAELFGYEAATNSKGEVIFRREGKLSGGIVITPEKLVQLFEKQIKAEASCGSDSILETAIHYGIVESVELALLDEGEDET